MRRGLMAWSREEVAPGVFERRVAALAAGVRARGLDCVLAYTDLTRPAAVSALTHFIPYWSNGVLVVTPCRGRHAGRDAVAARERLDPVDIAARRPRQHIGPRQGSCRSASGQRQDGAARRRGRSPEPSLQRQRGDSPAAPGHCFRGRDRSAGRGIGGRGRPGRRHRATLHGDRAHRDGGRHGSRGQPRGEPGSGRRRRCGPARRRGRDPARHGARCAGRSAPAPRRGWGRARRGFHVAGDRGLQGFLAAPRPHGGGGRGTHRGLPQPTPGAKNS